MFIDFYALLEISSNASQEEIKIAYRKQCIKWHPDKNPNTDTTQRMQDIRHAYLILKDEEARKRSDKEYFRFKTQFENISKESSSEKEKKENSSKSKSREQKEYTYYNYKFEDEILNKWMENARNQAKQMAKNTIDEFRGASLEATTSIGNYFLKIMIPMFIGFLLLKACQS